MTTQDMLKRTYQESLAANIDISKPVTIEGLGRALLKSGAHFSLSLDRLPELYSESHNFPADTDVGLYEHINFLPAYLHAHEYYEIVYVINGKCTNYFPDQSLEMKSGDILIILPGQEHALSAFDSDTKVINIVVRSSTFATSFLSVLQGDDILSTFFLFSQQSAHAFPFILFSTGNDERLKSLIQSAFEEHSNDLPYKKRILNATLTLFFVELLRRHEDSIKYPFKFDGRKTLESMNLLQYLYDNHKNITLNELADHFSYSPRNISRLIKKYTGQTFTELVSNIKLREATSLLTGSVLSIEKIAELTGYASTSQFYRSFRTKHGVSPSSYRKQVVT